MKKVGGAILRAIIAILLVGGIGFLVTNGTRLINENNSMQKEAKIALEVSATQPRRLCLHL